MAIEEVISSGHGVFVNDGSGEWRRSGGKTARLNDFANEAAKAASSLISPQLHPEFPCLLIYSINSLHYYAK